MGKNNIVGENEKADVLYISTKGTIEDGVRNCNPLNLAPNIDKFDIKSNASFER